MEVVREILCLFGMMRSIVPAQDRLAMLKQLVSVTGVTVISG